MRKNNLSEEESLQTKSKGSRENPFTISEINRTIRYELESNYPGIWLVGEISNLKPHTSGHHYFSLKDSEGQIQAVMFYQQNRRLKFTPEDGLEVLVFGKLSLYVPRGTFQIIVEEMEPKGIGSLQYAYEQLKKKLEAEGLFDESRKRPIPALPRRIGIVTSPTGAAIRDMMRILAGISIEIIVYPSRVQGEEAAPEIVEGIKILNRMTDLDLIIVGRGGGSMEDLWPFNEEAVVRAIVQSKIPVISAVGHETDFTISDFVADRRAPTPSAAAAMIVQKSQELEARLATSIKELIREGKLVIQEQGQKLVRLERSKGFLGIEAFIQEKMQRIDDLERRVLFTVAGHLDRVEGRLKHLRERLSPAKIALNLASALKSASSASKGLERVMVNLMRAAEEHFSRLSGLLNSLSPLAVLERGYSICRTPDRTKIIRLSSEVSIGDNVDIKLYQGSLLCNVKGKEDEEEKSET
ncbi:MAG: exodeoxyribonuclease VII large subunit [Acidobacteriota bacterium]